MLTFDFVEDQGLSSVLNSLISCMLPHENYDKLYFRDIYESVDKLIKLEEMDLPYSLLFSTLGKLGDLVVLSEQYEPKLSEKDYDRMLSSSLVDYLDRNKDTVARWMAEQGDAVNLDIREHFDRAAQYIFSRSMELYRTCFELEEDSSNYPILVITLKEEFKSNVVAETHRILSKILVDGCWIGRKKYKGYDDYTTISLEMSSEIQDRLSDEEADEVYTLDDPIKTKELMDKNKASSQVIGKWGIPPLDDFTPKLRHRLVVLVAGENVGKTIMSCHQTAQSIIEGKKVLYMCGESDKADVNNKIVSSYIGKKYDMCVTEAQVKGIEEISDEGQRLINLANIEISRGGNLSYIDSLTYDRFYHDCANVYNKVQFDMLVVDHSMALEDSPSSKLKSDEERVKALAVGARKFKKKFPVCVVICSHLSSNAEMELNKYKAAKSSPTRGSGVLAKEADEIFIMYKTDLLDKQNLVAMQVKKRRTSRVPTQHIYLKVNYLTIDFTYRFEDQLDSASTVKKESLINDISSILDNDDDGDSEISLFDDM